jgi:hypothetical protein
MNNFAVACKEGENVQQFQNKKVNRKSHLTDLKGKITKYILKKHSVMTQTVIQTKQDVSFSRLS